MERHEFLDQAATCICTDRQEQYGQPEDSFQDIADLWSAYRGQRFTPRDVGIMMALMKIARIKGGQFKADSYIDCIGYIACAGEIESK